MVTTVDADVITLVLAHLSFFEVDFNFGNDKKFYYINGISSRITFDQRFALMFFFTDTDGDMASSFNDISKCTWWKLWCPNPFVTETFGKLS